jgi:signal transduction histidine kinase
VLDLSKIEAGRMALTLGQTDLRDAITGAVADTASLRSAKSQECTLDLDESSLEVVADGVRVRQVLYNLLSNASKFTPEGGRIALAARRTRAPLRVPADRAGDDRRMTTQDVVWVKVVDTGIGIAPGDMDKLFQEFSQVDSSPSRQAQGTGLGLALSRKFVEMHGGRIGAESAPGKGSSFWFILPIEGPRRRASDAHLVAAEA